MLKERNTCVACEQKRGYLAALAVLTLLFVLSGCGGSSGIESLIEPGCSTVETDAGNPDVRTHDAAVGAAPEASMEAAPEVASEATVSEPSTEASTTEADVQEANAQADVTEADVTDTSMCLPSGSDCNQDAGPSQCCPGLTCQPVPYTHPIPDRCLSTP